MKAAAYLRYSSINQEGGHSIEAQKRAIDEFCAAQGHSIVKYYIDEAESATSDERPQFQRMMDDLRLFECVIVHKLDRFSRNRYDSAIYRKKLKKNRVRLISVLENFDDSPESGMMLSVLEGMAEYFSANLSRETKKGLKESALKCQHTGGKPPLGYDVIDKTYIINELEADTVRLIYNMYAKGCGFSDILTALKDRTTKFGKPFGKNSLHDLLKNEKYAGVYFYGRSIKHPDGSRNHDSKKPDIRIEGGIPAIIDKETFERVQVRMRSNLHKTLHAKENYLLSGLIVCGLCGGSMCGNRLVKSNGAVYAYYECVQHKQTKTCSMKRIRKESAEDLALSMLKEHVFSEEAIDGITQDFFKALHASDDTANAEIKKIKDLISDLDTKISNTIDFIADGKGTPGMMEKLKAWESQKDKYQTKINELRVEAKIFSLDENAIRDFVKKHTIDYSSPESIKKILQTFVEKIEVFPHEIKLFPKLGTAWYLQSVTVLFPTLKGK